MALELIAMKHLAPILLLVATSAVFGGSIRYELPSLLGEHTYDGGLAIINAAALIDIPFDFYAVEVATLVVEGTVSPGIAHGDGVIRENTTFVLSPSVSVHPSFSPSIDTSAQPTPATFRFERKYTYPFVPETVPLPNPGGYPPISFVIWMSVGPSLVTQYPPLVGSPDDILSPGIIVDVPIVAQIETAYIDLSGARIVPESNIIALVCSLIVSTSGYRQTFRRRR